MKIAPHVLVIVALAGLLVAGLRSESVTEVVESRLHAAAGKLRIGMRPEEARSALRIPGSCGPELTRLCGSLWVTYSDCETGESLTLRYEDQSPPRVIVLSPGMKHMPETGQSDFRLVTWHLTAGSR